MTLTSQDRKRLRADAQTISTAFHLGKGGVTEATVAELRRQLKENRLVKVRLLPSATHESSDKAQAEALAEAVGAELVEVRGHTCVLYRARRGDAKAHS